MEAMRVLSWVMLLAAAAGAARAQERVVESVVPALLYNSSCHSSVSLRNLGLRPVTVEVEGHKSTGALAALNGLAANTVRMAAGERVGFTLTIEEETTDAWVRVRERVPSPGLSPVIAVAGATECVSGNQLRTVARGVGFPTRDPWFSGDVRDLPGAVLTLINASERPVTARTCYSSGGLYSVPGETRAGGELRPLCSASFEVQIAPFGSRQFPVEREGNTHFSLRTEGAPVLLEMLQPVDLAVKLYTVNSSIRFGEEVPASPPKL
jgi:hypothetical protein